MKTATQSRHGDVHSGFTLIEILVAAGITTLLAGLMAVVVHNVSTTWKRASGRLGTDAQARLILDQIEQDLHGAIFRDDGASGTAYFAVDVLDRTNNSGFWQT